MKHINLISKISICLYFVLTILIVTECGGESVGEKSFNIDMEKINGEWINTSYKLPKDAYFFISENKGSYSLSYDRKGSTWWNKSVNGITIRNGIIDYKVNN